MGGFYDSTCNCLLASFKAISELQMKRLHRVSLSCGYKYIIASRLLTSTCCNITSESIQDCLPPCSLGFREEPGDEAKLNLHVQ